jgi:hypothetical protein
MEKSNIKLSKGDLTVELLPELGGRISSIKITGCEEWVTQAQSELVPRSPGDNFIRPEISGWDEMVPTTDACTSLNDSKELPDHGEVWARSWEVLAESADSALLSVELKVRTLKFSRSISLFDKSKGKYRINLGYKLENVGPVLTPAFWSCHPMFRGEGVKSVRVASNKPLIQTAPPSPAMAQTFLPSDLAHGNSIEYWCETDDEIEKVEILRDSGEVLAFEWDKSEIPYFGIFIDNFDYCQAQVISPQPAIAYKVSERSAESAGRIPILAPGEIVQWKLSIFLDREL